MHASLAHDLDRAVTQPEKSDKKFKISIFGYMSAKFAGRVAEMVESNY